jgi:hypothetical protein
MTLEKRPRASFRQIFNWALALGTLSRRRVYSEAVKYEREQTRGCLWPARFTAFPAAVALADVKAIEVVTDCPLPPFQWSSTTLAIMGLSCSIITGYLTGHIYMTAYSHMLSFATYSCTSCSRLLLPFI